jgi:hypothetical protein
MNDSADWTSSGLTPALWWDTALRSADGAVLACPQCGDQHLHLEKIRYATPSDDTYTPTIGVSIHGPHIAIAIDGEDDDEALRLHNGTNRGPMLDIGYWCENGCQGRIELREHEGHLYLSLHEEPLGVPDFVTSAIEDAHTTTGGASPTDPVPTEPAF